SEHFVFSTNEIFNTQLGQVGAGFAPLSESGYAVYPQWIDQERFMFITSSAAGWELRLGRIGAPSTVIASGSGNPLQLQISYDFRF
ncbi:MAG: hypothetical protein U1B80_02305, partial [Anaerolineaceae bacterium]|nr:hypothetical protein [Anaerolineaceae bacterium]